jgi:uncharacterized protein (DUF1684 family)
MNKTTRRIPKILSFKSTNYFSQTCEWRIASKQVNTGTNQRLSTKAALFVANMADYFGFLVPKT